MAHVLGCDTMQATHPLLLTVVTGIDVLNAENAALIGANGWARNTVIKDHLDRTRQMRLNSVRRRLLNSQQ
jgi:hypothetical protein